MELNEFMMRCAEIPFRPLARGDIRRCLYDHAIEMPVPSDPVAYPDPRGHVIDHACGWRFVVWKVPHHSLLMSVLVALGESPMTQLHREPKNLQWIAQVASAAMNELSGHRHIWVAHHPQSYEPLRFYALLQRERTPPEITISADKCRFWAKRLVRGLQEIGVDYEAV